MWINVEVVNSVRIKGARSSDEAVDLVTLLQEEFGQIRTILPGNAGDEGVHLVCLVYLVYSVYQVCSVCFVDLVYFVNLVYLVIWSVSSVWSVWSISLVSQSLISTLYSPGVSLFVIRLLLGSRAIRRTMAHITV